MRAKETRKWVDRMEKAAKSAKPAASDDVGKRASKKRKLTTPLVIKSEDSIKSTIPGKDEAFTEPINMSVAHGANSIEAPHDGSPTFPYKPLDNNKLEIRVVTLKPGLTTAPIECTLTHIATGKKTRPAYKALSYTWGSPGIQKTILLDGIQVRVRENLWQALFHLRKKDSPIRFWIDAICINQDDVLERNLQVARMGTLYSLAEEVVVWLGLEEYRSRQAFEFIDDCMSCKAGSLPANFTSKLSSSPELTGIMCLTSRDYWSRMWIIQEIFRARKIYIQCGFQRLPWITLGRFFRFVERQLKVDEGSEDKTLTYFRESLPAQLTKHRTAQETDLETLLRTYKSSLCIDPRDKLFSLLGLAGRRLSASAKKKPRNQWISVDYSKSAQELFQSLALLFHKEGGRPGQFTSNHANLSSVLPVSDGLSVKEASTYYQVERMQLLQDILGIQWPERGCYRSSSQDKAAQNLTCTTRYKARVSKFSGYGVTFMSPEKIMAWYSQVVEPHMPSPLAVLAAVEALNCNDIDRLRCFSQTDDFIKTESQEPATGLFTTRNGRVGITACNIDVGDCVVRFAGCDVAVITGPLLNGIKGRAFIVKSDSRPSRGMGLSSLEAAAFRYATPDVQDDEFYDLREMDNDGVDGVFVNQDLADEKPRTSLTLSLEDWQALTW